MALWHQPAAVVTNEVVEAVVPIDRTVEASEDVAVYELAGGPAISVIHEGPLPQMIRAHGVLISWMEENGYELAGPYREVYVRTSDQGAEEVVEIQYPVARIS